MLIGLMGKSGSGKTLVSNLFKEIDVRIQIIDVDKIGHMSHSDPEVKEKLKLCFGEEIFDANSNVNRKALAKIVFSSQEKMDMLYECTYDYMTKIIDEKVKESDITILDYALLPLTKYYELCDVKILVEASYKIRSTRAIKRDNISKAKYDLRDANSMDYSSFEFDYIIHNNKEIDKLRKTIGEIYEKSIIPR